MRIARAVPDSVERLCTDSDGFVKRAACPDHRLLGLWPPPTAGPNQFNAGSLVSYVWKKLMRST